MHDFSFCVILTLSKSENCVLSGPQFIGCSVSQFILTFGLMINIQLIFLLISTFRKKGMVAATEDLFKKTEIQTTQVSQVADLYQDQSHSFTIS